MNLLTLKRIAILNDGAFGVLLFKGVPFAVTLERTFDTSDGKQRIVVPEGMSACRRGRYNEGGYDTFEIIVPGHTEVKFHKGNVELHSEGCILVAESFSVLGGKPGVALSAEGFTEFMKKLAGYDDFVMEVVTA